MNACPSVWHCSDVLANETAAAARQKNQLLKHLKPVSADCESGMHVAWETRLQSGCGPAPRTAVRARGLTDAELVGGPRPRSQSCCPILSGTRQATSQGAESPFWAEQTQSPCYPAACDGARGQVRVPVLSQSPRSLHAHTEHCTSPVTGRCDRVVWQCASPRGQAGGGASVDTDPTAEGAPGGRSGPGSPRAAAVFPWPTRALTPALALTDAVVSEAHFTTAVKVRHAALKRGIIEPVFPKYNLPSSHGTDSL